MHGRGRGWSMLTLCMMNLLIACEPEFLVHDGWLQLWCGDSLCHWQLDRGEVEATPTWHEDDLGLRLLDVAGGTEISQVVETQADCIALDLLVDVAAAAAVEVAIDFNADGTEDVVKSLASDGWHTLEHVVRSPALYQDLRLIVRKSGQGQAVLARVSMRPSRCGSLEPLRLEPQNDGSLCRRDAD